MGTKYSVTGTVDVDTDAERHVIWTTIRDLQYVEHIVTGGAYGVDTHAAKFGKTFHVYAHHVLYYPAGLWWNNTLLHEKWLFDETHPVVGGYMTRNDMLVAACDTLLAFPKTAVEQVRSGTWATVRRARKAGKEIRIFPLDGSEMQLETAASSINL